MYIPSGTPYFLKSSRSEDVGLIIAAGSSAPGKYAYKTRSVLVVEPLDARTESRLDRCSKEGEGRDVAVQARDIADRGYFSPISTRERRGQRLQRPCARRRLRPRCQARAVVEVSLSAMSWTAAPTTSSHEESYFQLVASSVSAVRRRRLAVKSLTYYN